ncbi:hypothetical protein CGZ65_08730 [Neisseria weixii]|nr:hypothetical protein CGZ65_08730 [Neisseria weixii]
MNLLLTDFAAASTLPQMDKPDWSLICFVLVQGDDCQILPSVNTEQARKFHQNPPVSLLRRLILRLATRTGPAFSSRLA